MGPQLVVEKVFDVWVPTPQVMRETPCPAVGADWTMTQIDSDDEAALHEWRRRGDKK